MHWKQYPFFEKIEFTKALKEDVACSAASQSYIYLGLATGVIQQLNMSLCPMLNWKSHQKINFIRPVKNNVLLVIGEDLTETAPNNSHSKVTKPQYTFPVLKVYDLNKLEKNNTAPELIKSIEIIHGNKIFPVTAFAVLFSMNMIAIGLENGLVLLYRNYKPKVVFEGSEMITALGFRQDLAQSSLFIVTMNQILNCNISEKDVIVCYA